jgi:hypothetical protein
VKPRSTGSQYLDSFSNADCAVIPDILRPELLNLGALWDRYSVIAAWCWRCCKEPIEILSRSEAVTSDSAESSHMGPGTSSLLT